MTDKSGWCQFVHSPVPEQSSKLLGKLDVDDGGRLHMTVYDQENGAWSRVLMRADNFVPAPTHCLDFTSFKLVHENITSCKVYLDRFDRTTSTHFVFWQKGQQNSERNIQLDGDTEPIRKRMDQRRRWCECFVVSFTVLLCLAVLLVLYS